MEVELRRRRRLSEIAAVDAASGRSPEATSAPRSGCAATRSWKISGRCLPALSPHHSASAPVAGSEMIAARVADPRPSGTCFRTSSPSHRDVTARCSSPPAGITPRRGTPAGTPRRDLDLFDQLEAARPQTVDIDSTTKRPADPPAKWNNRSPRDSTVPPGGEAELRSTGGTARGAGRRTPPP